MNEATHGVGVETHRNASHRKLAGASFQRRQDGGRLFRVRSTVGLDVALEALQEGWRERRFTSDELWRYARICRVANLMRPYLEATVAA